MGLPSDSIPAEDVHPVEADIMQPVGSFDAPVTVAERQGRQHTGLLWVGGELFR